MHVPNGRGHAERMLPVRIAVGAASFALAAMSLLACNQSTIVTEPKPAPQLAQTSSVPASQPMSFASFPESYFSTSTFFPLASSSARASRGTDATGSTGGMRLASLGSTPVLEPPAKYRRAGRGIASLYSFDTKTASGERFNARELTAAHRTLPFGTKVRVTSVKTGKSVTVRINDRGPYVPGRIVDLSYAAANELGMVKRGLTEVTLDVVE
jgi:peptidoglycan lytic transglycosylase